jgi:uncharacterized YigZ family protein
MPTSYVTPLTDIRREHLVVNSRFIATLTPASSQEAARAFIARVKAEFADAQHNVPAYIIGSGNTVTEFSSDDGEPSGTAGKPALAVLRGSGLGDVAVVITRYFGGTLLGTGGLVKAYTESTQMVVNAVPRGRRIAVHIVIFVIPYPLLERMRAVAALHKADIMGEDFGADITMTIRIPVESFEAFQTELGERSAGKSSAEIIETTEAVVAI